MEQKALTTEQIKITENFLLGYKQNKLMLRIEQYGAMKYNGYGGHSQYEDYDTEEDENDPSVASGLIGARLEMHKVRHFIINLPSCEEKLLLYFHYVKGETVEACAELIGVSRRSAFRLRHKALALAYSELVRLRLVKSTDTQASDRAC